MDAENLPKIVAGERQITFAEYRLDLTRGSLFRSGHRVHLRPQAYAALEYLAVNRGRLVTKDELVRHVWQGRAVTDDSLVQCLRDVRRALGEHSACLQTERGRGYIFDPGNFSSAAADSEAAATEVTAAQPAGLGAKSISRRHYRRTAVGIGSLTLITAALVAALRPFGAGEVPTPSFVKLTSSAGVHIGPTLSPDGNWFAYSVTSAPGGADEEIHLRAVGGWASRCLTCGVAGRKLHPVFSPDGREIAFAMRSGGIFLVGRDGTSLRRLTANGFHPTWSPDGGEIAYSTTFTDWIPHEYPYSRSELWVVDRMSGATRQLHVGDARDPAWSPDGRRIAFSSLSQHHWNRAIFTVPVAGGEPTALTDSGADDRHPLWGVDGKSVYFVSNRGGARGLWRVQVDQNPESINAPPEAVVLPSTFVTSPRFGPGGSLIYSDAHAESNVALLSFDASTATFSGALRNVTRGTGFWLTPHVAAGSEWLALSHLAIGIHEDIFIVRSDGTGLRRLTDDPARDRDPQVAPDGRRVAFASDRGGKWGIWVVNSDGSNLRPISPQSATTVWARPHWSPDSRSIAAWEEPGRRTVLFDVDATTLEPALVLPQPPDGPVQRVSHMFDHRAWSSDGGQLALKSGKTLLIYSIRNRTYRTAGVDGAILGWIPQTSLLMLAVPWKRQFLLVDTETWHTRPIPYPPQIPDGDVRFSLSVDSRTLSVTHATFSGDVWLAMDPSRAHRRSDKASPVGVVTTRHDTGER